MNHHVPSGWKRAAFDSVIRDVTGGNAKVPASDFLAQGMFPIVDQGQQFVAGYSDNASHLCKAELPVIVFGDHTRCFKYIDFPFCIGADGTKVLRPATGVDPRYLYYFLRQLNLPPAGYSRHFKYLRNSEVLIPPFTIQRQIAEVLDRVEQLRAKRRVALELLHAMTTAVFAELFGPLHQPAVSVGDRLDPHPRGWRWELLTDVARLATGHTPDRAKSEYWGGGIPWITLSDIRRLDGEVAHSTGESVTEEGIRNSSAVKLPAGTVCFSRTASVGFVTVMGREMATSQDFVNWVCGPRLSPTYVLHAFMQSRSRLRALSTGSTHKTIYFPTVERFRLLVPPRSLQDHFTRRVGLLDELKAAHLASGAELDTLFASLQHRAFRGEL
jgi:type I restriction enzyme S subunit